MTDTATLTLADFLLARVAEDATEAHRQDLARLAANNCLAATEIAGDLLIMVDPDRVLAECEAKSRIVQLHAMEEWRSPGVVCELCSTYDRTGIETHAEPFPCATLRALSLPYTDHPDYRDEWRP